MEYVKLMDMQLSRFILGTDGYGEKIDKKTAFALMTYYAENGGNVLDTARMYTGGRSETIVGEFARANRGSVLISSKCAFPPAEDMHKSRLSREEIEGDIDASLKALGVEQIDIMWLHRDDENLPVEPIIDTMNEMLSKGKIRHFGASNWRYDRIREANRYAEKAGLTGFCASQVLYNMATCSYVWDDTLVVMEGEEREKYEASPFPVFAFSSQAKGFFEKYRTNSLSEKAKARYLNPESEAAYEKIAARAAEKGETVSHAALQMLIEESAFDVFPILGTRSVEQLKASLHIK